MNYKFLNRATIFPLIASSTGLALLLWNVYPLAATQEAGQPRAKTFVAIDTKVPLADLKPMSELAIPGKRAISSASKDFYSNDVRVGVFEGEPGIARVTDWPHDEFITLIFGEVVITDAAGTTRIFRGGDSFVLPKGFTGTYEIKTKMREIYVFGP